MSGCFAPRCALDFTCATRLFRSASLSSSSDDATTARFVLFAGGDCEEPPAAGAPAGMRSGVLTLSGVGGCDGSRLARVLDPDREGLRLLNSRLLLASCFCVLLPGAIGRSSSSDSVTDWPSADVSAFLRLGTSSADRCDSTLCAEAASCPSTCDCMVSV